MIMMMMMMVMMMMMMMMHLLLLLIMNVDGWQWWELVTSSSTWLERLMSMKLHLLLDQFLWAYPPIKLTASLPLKLCGWSRGWTSPLFLIFRPIFYGAFWFVSFLGMYTQNHEYPWKRLTSPLVNSQVWPWSLGRLKCSMAWSQHGPTFGSWLVGNIREASLSTWMFCGKKGGFLISEKRISGG